MPLDPRIALMGQNLDVGKAFNSALTNIQGMNNIKAQEQTALQTKELQKEKSMVNFSFQAGQFLENGDIEGAMNFTQNRINTLNANGIDSTDTQEFATALKSNPEQAKALAGQGVEYGKAQGYFNNNQGQTNKQRELQAFNQLPESTPEEKEYKKQYGIAIGAISKLQTTEEKLNLESGKADIKTDQKLTEFELLEKTRTGQQKIQLSKINIDETKIKNLEQRQQAIDAKNVRRVEADNATFIVDELLKDDSFSNAFGKVNNLFPENAQPQANIDARAQVKQVLGLISLESRQKLKGQGTITDSEMATLKESATLLANPKISDELARKELRRVKRIFEDASDRNRLKRTPINNQVQNTVIKFDAQGNMIQ